MVYPLNPKFEWCWTERLCTPRIGARSGHTPVRPALNQCENARYFARCVAAYPLFRHDLISTREIRFQSAGKHSRGVAWSQAAILGPILGGICLAALTALTA